MKEHETIAAALFNRGARVHVQSVEDTGMVAWDERGRVRGFAAPASARTPLARIIHAHELMHSRYSARSECRSFPDQIAEDCVIHLAAHRHAERVGSGAGVVPHLWRDALRVALTECRSALRTIRGGASGELAERARGIVLRATYLPFIACPGPESTVYRRLMRAHRTMIRIADRVLCAGPRAGLLHSFDLYAGETGSLVERLAGMRRVSASRRSYLVTYRNHTYRLAAQIIREPDPAPAAPGADRTGNRSGDGVHRMEPPLTHPCAPPLAGMRRVASVSGARIRTHRLAAVATGAESLPFTRRVRRPDVSCVVLDLSGSMHWNDETLARLCAALPRTSVYGYCDYAPPEARGVDGTIIRLAANGRRVAKIPRLANGNGCDMQAVELALAHPGRVVFVSDRGFCGQSADRTQRARQLLRDNPRVQVIETRDAALAAFNA